MSTSSTEEKTEEQPNEDDKKEDKGTDNDEEEIAPTTPSVTLGDVIGCDNIKEEIKPYVEFLKNREIFLNLGGNVCSWDHRVGSQKPFDFAYII